MPEIGPGLVGRALEEIPWAWTDRDTILYALSVGARVRVRDDVVVDGVRATYADVTRPAPDAPADG